MFNSYQQNANLVSTWMDHCVSPVHQRASLAIPPTVLVLRIQHKIFTMNSVVRTLLLSIVVTCVVQHEQGYSIWCAGVHRIRIQFWREIRCGSQKWWRITDSDVTAKDDSTKGTIFKKLFDKQCSYQGGHTSVVVICLPRIYKKCSLILLLLRK